MTEKTNNEQEASHSLQSPNAKLEQDWQDILAGRTVSDADPAARQEAEVLRATILQKYQEALAANKANHSDPDQSQALNRLLDRLDNLDKEGLLEKSQLAAQRRWFQSFNLPSNATIAVASVLIIALTLWIALPFSDKPLMPQTSVNFQEPPRLRSGMSTQSISVDTPRHSRETAKQLIGQLDALNIAYRLTPLEGDDKPDWQLEIYIPFEPEQNILTFLQRWCLKETKNGWIRIVPEIESVR